MYINPNDIKNIDESLTGGGDSCLNYASDNIRLDYLKQGLDKQPVSNDGMIDPSNIENADDLVVVLNHGNYVMFYEMFVESCWEALFEKPEFSGLSEEKAIEKLVMTRFAKIAQAAGEKLLDWNMDWEDEILSVKISNSKIKKMKKLKEVIQEAIKSSEKSNLIKDIAKKGSLDISKYDMDELIMGYEVEKEHGTVNPVTNVTDDDEVKTLKIAIAHLNEVPDYYTKLDKYVENEDENIDEATVNPWAVCTSSVGRSNKDKYEKCVMDVKKKQGMHQESEEIDEKSVSKKQQRFMGQVHALQSGQLEPKDINPKFRKNITKVAHTMKAKDAEDFAKTKLKGLPEKKKKTNENDDMSEKKSKNKLILKDSVDNMTPEKIELTKKFICFCLQELGIKEHCIVYLTGKRGGPIKTTASFFPDNNEIWIYCKNRNMLGDVCRSIAHELRHLKQNLDGVITDKSGLDGSTHENEANSFSGLMIRKFGKLHPDIYL